MSPIKGKWKGIISLYSCSKYTSLYMTKIASVWSRANGVVDDDVAWVEGFTASQPLNESLWSFNFECQLVHGLTPVPNGSFEPLHCRAPHPLWIFPPQILEQKLCSLWLFHFIFLYTKAALFVTLVILFGRFLLSSHLSDKKMVQSGRGPPWTKLHLFSLTCRILLTSAAALNLNQDVVFVVISLSHTQVKTIVKKKYPKTSYSTFSSFF